MVGQAAGSGLEAVELDDAVPGVVDVDDGAARAVQQAGGDAGAVAGAAVHPQLAGGQRGRELLDVLHGHVDGAAQVAVLPLVALADVDHHDAPALGQGRPQVVPVGPPVLRAARLSGVEHVRADALDADPGEVGERVVEHVGGVGEKHDVVAPRHQPADVGGELGGVLDADGARQVSVGVVGTRAQVDHPGARRARRR